MFRPAQHNGPYIPVVAVDRQKNPLANQLEAIRSKHIEQWTELTSGDAVRIVKAIFQGKNPEQGVSIDAARELASIPEIRDAISRRAFDLMQPVSSRQASVIHVQQHETSVPTKTSPVDTAVPEKLATVILTQQRSDNEIVVPEEDVEAMHQKEDEAGEATTQSEIEEAAAIFTQLIADLACMQTNIADARQRIIQILTHNQNMLAEQRGEVARLREQLANVQQREKHIPNASVQKTLDTNVQQEESDKPQADLNPVTGMQPWDAVEYMLNTSGVIKRELFEKRREYAYMGGVPPFLQREIVRIIQVLRAVEGAEGLFLYTYKINPDDVKRYESIYAEKPRHVFTEPILARRFHIVPPEQSSHAPAHVKDALQKAEKPELPPPDPVQKTIPDAVSPDVEMIHPVLTMEQRIAAFTVPPLEPNKRRNISLEGKKEFVALYLHLKKNGKRGDAKKFALQHGFVPPPLARFQEDIRLAEEQNAKNATGVHAPKKVIESFDIDAMMEEIEALMPPKPENGKKRSLPRELQEKILALCVAMRKAKDHRLSAFLEKHHLVASESHWRRQQSTVTEDEAHEKPAQTTPVAHRERAGDHGPLPVFGISTNPPIQISDPRTGDEVEQWEATQTDGRTGEDRIRIITTALGLKDNPDARNAFYKEHGLNAATVTGWFNVYRDLIQQLQEEAKAPRQIRRTIPSPATPSLGHRRGERRHNANSAQQKPQENPQLVILDHLMALIQIPVLTAADINKRLTEIQTTPGDVFGPLQIAQRAYLQTISPLLREEQAEFEQLQSTHYGHRSKLQKERWNQLVRKHKQLLNLEVQLDKIAEVLVGILQKPHHARERYEEGALPELIQRLWKKLLVDIEDAIDLYNLEQED